VKLESVKCIFVSLVEIGFTVRVNEYFRFLDANYQNISVFFSNIYFQDVRDVIIFTALPHLLRSKMGHKYEFEGTNQTLIASSAETADAIIVSIHQT
jgi:hypothetical protein